MVFVLEIPAGPADRLLFLTGTPPEDGAVLEMCSDSAREIVLVESQAGSRSVWVQRAYGGPLVCGEVRWPPGTRLRMPVEFAAVPGGWECGLCRSLVTRDGRDGHAEWHEELRIGV